MKKLLFITWSVSYGYGTEKSLADVLNRMDGSEYDISVLPLFKNSDNCIFNKNIRVLPPLIDYTSRNFDEEKALNNYYSLLSNPLRFNRLLNDKYDCVIACNHNAPSYFASCIKGGAKLLWIRGDMRKLDYKQFDPNTDQYRTVKKEYEMQAKVLKYFDFIAVISDVAQRTLSELFGITENVVKISNSVDSEKMKLFSCEKIKVPRKAMFISLGRLDYNKNQILLLKAACEVKKKRDDFMAYLLGDGEERPTLEEYIRKNDLEKNVKILGFIENPYPYIKNSTATVLTSLSEGFSLVLVESVMLDTPIISTDVGVARELIDKYKCGELISYDEKELASVMIKYIAKYDGHKAPFGIGNEYDIKTEVKQTIDLIDTAIEKSFGEAKIKKLPYPEITVNEYELNGHEIRVGSPYVLRVIKDGVPYEYLIDRKNGSDKLIVFNNGAVAGGNVSVPVFQRHSWAKSLKCSSIYCMDPTLYLNSFLQIGWGIGKNDNYYLENSIADAFEKHGFVPKIYLHVNLCSAADNSAQLVPFLKSAETMNQIGEYNDIEVFLHYEPEKGHNGLNMDDALGFLYGVLKIS